MEKLCFLFGHSIIPAALQEQIQEAAWRHYRDHGIRQFYVGYHGQFDQTAIAALRNLKGRCPDITLMLVTPYHPSAQRVFLPEGFDGFYYPEGMEAVPPRFAIVRANRLMIRAADSVICYVQHGGNSRALLEQARKRQQKQDIPVENLAASIH